LLVTEQTNSQTTYNQQDQPVNQFLFNTSQSIKLPVDPVSKDPELHQFTMKLNIYGEAKQNEKFALHLFILSFRQQVSGSEIPEENREKQKCAKSIKTGENYLVRLVPIHLNAHCPKSFTSVYFEM